MKKIVAMLLALTMVLALCACGGGGDKAGANDDYHLTLKLSHVFATTEQLTIEMQQVAQRIKERTNGAIEISATTPASSPSIRTTSSRSSTAPTGSPAKTPPTSPTTTSTLKHSSVP